MKKTSKSAIHGLFIAGFCLILVLSAVLAVGNNALISPTENRMLAARPSLTGEDGGLNENLLTDTESWLNDHLGFRASYQDLYARFALNLFRVSPDDRVHMGKEGWFFLNTDEHIEIGAKAVYLSDRDLEQIAERQQMYSDYYHAMGKEYYLLLTPGKASVYPEYLEIGDGLTGDTMIDQLTDYLTAHTDVRVINAKDCLMAAKADGKDLFYRHDTHFSGLGSYTVYRDILDRLVADGILSDDPVPVQHITTRYTQGDLSKFLGGYDVLGPEDSPDFSFTPAARYVTEGEHFTRMQTLWSRAQRRSAMNEVEDSVYFSNPEKQGTLLLYGDSQMQIERKISNLLAEHFGIMIYQRVRQYDSALDDASGADLVIFQCSERYIKGLLREQR